MTSGFSLAGFSLVRRGFDDLAGWGEDDPRELIAALEMKKRYGFIFVDKDNEGNGTLNRSKKKSFDWYKQVIASNGEQL